MKVNELLTNSNDTSWKYNIKVLRNSRDSEFFHWTFYRPCRLTPTQAVSLHPCHAWQVWVVKKRVYVRHIYSELR
jgi:hypothetical protein